MAQENHVNGAFALPERVLHGGIRRVHGESARDDVVGVVARALLSAVHVPAATAADFFTRLEHETVVVARPARRRRASSPAASRQRSTGTRAGGTRRGTGTRSRSTQGRGRGRRPAPADTLATS